MNNNCLIIGEDQNNSIKNGNILYTFYVTYTGHNAYHMLALLKCFTYFNSPINFKSKSYYYPYFTYEETEPQKG